MTPEAVSALAAVATFFVVAASAIAALVQLRHLRTNNQISSMLEYERLLLDDDFLEKRSQLTAQLGAWLADPQALERIFARVGPEYRVLTSVGNLFENMGAMVRFGMLDRNVTLALWGHLAFSVWETVAPALALLRRNAGTDAIWENFEYLAALSKEYIERNSSGTYPTGVARLPLPE